MKAWVSGRALSQTYRHFSPAIAGCERLVTILCLIGALCVSSSTHADGGDLKREKAVKIALDAKQDTWRARLSNAAVIRIRHLNALVMTYSVVRPQDLKQIWDEDLAFSRGTSQFQQFNAILGNISFTPVNKDARSQDFRYWISGFDVNGRQSVEVFMDGSIDHVIAGSNVLALERQEKMRRLLRSLVWQKRAQSELAVRYEKKPRSVRVVPTNFRHSKQSDSSVGDHHMEVARGSLIGAYQARGVEPVSYRQAETLSLADRRASPLAMHKTWLTTRSISRPQLSSYQIPATSSREISPAVDAGGSTKDGDVTTQDAIQIAKRELQRRKLPLPEDHVARVEPSVAFREFASDRPIFLLTFRRPGSGISSLLYDVHIDRQSGIVQDVIDLRSCRNSASRRLLFGKKCLLARASRVCRPKNVE
jgi:hypothetical protein